MSAPRIAISIITYNRSQLLDVCLQSVVTAMKDLAFPITIIAQDPTLRDEEIFRKYRAHIERVERIKSAGRNVENLINHNRIRAWELSLIEEKNDCVICLEDDVEVASDFFEFTLAVLDQNYGDRKFFGINYGSFETDYPTGSYSKMRYGIHGPASLITARSYRRFRLEFLKVLRGRIAWDSWVEPITKTGFMVTSNKARYLDNGKNGTHASEEMDSSYFNKLETSFKSDLSASVSEYINIDVRHNWRSDCVPYKENENLVYQIKGLIMTIVQLKTAIINLFKIGS